MKKRLCFLLLPLLFLLASCHENTYPSNAKNGKLNLTAEDFGHSDLISLNGEWKFFWKELLTENEIKKRIKNGPQANITLPSKWEDTVGTSFGYGTYYLKVIIPEEKVGNTLAITTTNQNTSYTLLVNGVRVASNGFVGTSVQTSEPEYSNRLVYFTPRSRELDIVLHVSNFVHPNGGATNPIMMGTAEQVSKNYNTTLAYTMFIIGAILVMGIYELFIFFFRRKDKVFFYFGLISILISIYSFLKPPYYFNRVVSYLSWGWGDRLEIICIYTLFILYLFFVRTMYSKETSKVPIIIGISITVTAILITAFTEPIIYRPILNFVFVVITAYIIYFLFVLILAFKRKRPTAFINLCANLIFFGAVLNDVFLSLNWIHTMPSATIGFFLYVLIQSINLSKDYARKFDETEKLTVDLQKLNASLDEKIKERTEELKRKNDELKRLTLVDGLTGIYNRRYFDEYINKNFEEAILTLQPLSMLMIDVDNFKLYNDTKGHIAGDELLIKCSNLMKDQCSGNNFLARYGGEEFAIVLPNTSLQDAFQFAENIRLLIAEQSFSVGNDNQYVTVSIGVSSTEQHAFQRKEELIDRADQALYQSKENGKNRVTVL